MCFLLILHTSDADLSLSTTTAADTPGEDTELQGRRLFCHARSRLSVDQFEKFLETVRKLNMRTLTVDEALLETEKICGQNHAVIYNEFKALLTPKGAKTDSFSAHPTVVNVLTSAPSTA